MDSSSLLLLCILVTCSVWMVQGRSFEVSIDDEEASLMEGSTKAEGFSVVCKACQWALKRVKKMIGPNATAEKVTQVLKNVCDGAGPLKKKCHSFVDSHLRELVKELLTDDGVRTICIKTRALDSLTPLLFSLSDTHMTQQLSAVKH
uniref:Antimicrobial peptide NK-lysin-like n=1 Tax=Kryptolebias marmoratus TaxID=37003 RepID=A0A3Q3A5T9_KRYMA